jgi:hypothetical protein
VLPEVICLVSMGAGEGQSRTIVHWRRSEDIWSATARLAPGRIKASNVPGRVARRVIKGSGVSRTGTCC